jgi:hypothetical protein
MYSIELDFTDGDVATMMLDGPLGQNLPRPWNLVAHEVWCFFLGIYSLIIYSFIVIMITIKTGLSIHQFSMV